ncbi:MAG: hypothetical protein V7667_11455 [Alloalcanivorax venustensis]|uniref:DUF7281 domain-containing protein n=1 Tax=Alloalcanivorax venustensis TaxID=172371 RepID=UPI003002A6A3|tara:strand:- start:13577 stop:14437 length:861 start_codon:yes stop_codon:yes gene_type:complete
MPTKRVIQAALTVAQSAKREHKANRSHEVLANKGYGRVVGREYVVTPAERDMLQTWLKREGVPWDTPPEYYGTGHREEVAAHSLHEKHASRSTHDKRVLVQALSPGVRVNGHELPVLPVENACLSLSSDSIRSLEAGALVVIENSRAFHRFRNQPLAVEPHRWLAVYRGDTQHASGQSWAQAMAQRHRLRLYAYPDFDPAGLAIALDLGAEKILLPDIDELADFPGSEADFDRQQDQWTRVQNTVTPGSVLAQRVDFLGERKAGFTQERLLAAGKTLELVAIERLK